MNNENVLEQIDNKDLIRELFRRKMKIEDIPTYVLCDELERREGVKVVDVAPYEEKDIHVEGWATVFIVID